MERGDRPPAAGPLPFRTPVREAALVAAWEARRYLALLDDTGQRLQVVFPGRHWGGPGPDFRGALLAREDGTLLRGDIEVHVRASGWRLHGHRANRLYRDVVLHVVAIADEPTLGHGGEAIPTVLLAAPCEAPRPARPPCLRPADEVVRIVRWAGRERFAARAARFEGDIAAVGADQAVWRGVAEALGYVENAGRLARLADVVPWATAAEVAREGGTVAVSALLLGAAGFLAWATPEERAWWPGVAPLIAGAAAADSWELAAVRPGNHPIRRCRGLAALATLGAETGSLADRVVDAVRTQANRRWPRVWPTFHVRPWIGRGRAQTIVVNVALPFAFAAGCASSLALYERIPGEPWSRPLRYMADLLARPGLRFRAACERQGLLQIFKTACAARQCAGCPAASAWRLDEGDAFPLVRRRQGTTAAAADDAAAGYTGAIT